MSEVRTPQQERSIAKKKKIIEEIVKIQVTWMEEFASNYPYMAGNSRVIHSADDNVFTTSFKFSYTVFLNSSCLEFISPLGYTCDLSP